MRNVTPELEAPIVRVAEEQPEYSAVDVARVTHPDFAVPGVRWNAVVMAFRPDAAELVQLLAGEDLYIGLLTFGSPQQPINLFVGRDAAAAGYGVAVSARHETGTERPVPADERALAKALFELLDRASVSDHDIALLHAAAATIDDGPPHDPLAVALVQLARRLRPDLPPPAFAPTSEGSHA